MCRCREELLQNNATKCDASICCTTQFYFAYLKLILILLLSPQFCVFAVVSLGSALFTINSTFAFVSGPMVSRYCVMNIITNQQSKISASKLTLYPRLGMGCISCIRSNSIWSRLSWCWAYCKDFGS